MYTSNSTILLYIIIIIIHIRCVRSARTARTAANGTMAVRREFVERFRVIIATRFLGINHLRINNKNERLNGNNIIIIYSDRIYPRTRSSNSRHYRRKLQLSFCAKNTTIYVHLNNDFLSLHKVIPVILSTNKIY